MYCLITDINNIDPIIIFNRQLKLGTLARGRLVVTFGTPTRIIVGPAVQHTDIPPPKSATLGLHPVARKLLLISRPAKGRRLG